MVYIAKSGWYKCDIVLLPEADHEVKPRLRVIKMILHE